MEAPSFAKPALTVLIVDDEELLVRSCARILEHEGYVVQKASRGREALDIMRRQRPDIVLTDLMLPDVDGMTLLREAKRLRSEEHTSELQSRENLVCRLLLENKKGADQQEGQQTV